MNEYDTNLGVDLLRHILFSSFISECAYVRAVEGMNYLES